MDKIIVGSFEGKIRIMTPMPREFRIEDMLIEKDLGLPILQVDCAKNLISPKAQVLGGKNTQETTAIAVLHSRKLVIAAIVTSNDFSSYQEVHTHSFNRNAFNFIIGNFGAR